MLFALVGIGASFGLVWALGAQVYLICGAAMAIYVLCVFVRVADRVGRVADARLGGGFSYTPASFMDWIGTAVISIVFGAFWPFLLLVRIRQWHVDRALHDDEWATSDDDSDAA